MVINPPLIRTFGKFIFSNKYFFLSFFEYYHKKVFKTKFNIVFDAIENNGTNTLPLWEMFLKIPTAQLRSYKFVCLFKNIGLARVMLTIYTSNDIIANRCFHCSFKGKYFEYASVIFSQTIRIPQTT